MPERRPPARDGFRERRFDQSLTVVAAVGAGGAVERQRERRSSRFLRSRTPTVGWRTELVQLDDAEEHDLAPDPRAWERALAECEELLVASRRARAGIVVERAARRYENSEGVREAWTTSWCDALVEVRSRPGEPARIACSCAEIDQLASRIAAGLTVLERHAARLRRPPSPPPARARLLLRPRVAAILLHELVGHGAEEGLGIATGALPLLADAVHPRGEGHDDEGVRIEAVRLLGDDRRRDPLGDRESGSGRPSGLAQAPPHGASPRVRCTHLTVRATDPAAPLGDDREAIVCESAAAAELRGEAAVVRVDVAHRGSRAIAPFDLALTATGLADGLTAVGEAVGAQLGRCTKGGDTLPTSTATPALLLDGVPVTAA